MYFPFFLRYPKQKVKDAGALNNNDIYIYRFADSDKSFVQSLVVATSLAITKNAAAGGRLTATALVAAPFVESDS